MKSIPYTLRFVARHPLSSRRPLSAFWRYGRWQIESRLRREVAFRWVEGAKLIVRNGMTAATGNIYCGLHEFAEMAFLLHMLRPDDLFVDVGANIGSYTVLASAVCGARTIAVEPDPNTMQALRRNIDANRIDDRVQLVEAALGAESRTVRFTIGRDTTNRVAVKDDTETREVRMKRLDDLLVGLDPIFIKIDVEGYEDEVLRGAAKTLRNPSLLAVETETFDDDVRRHLETAGFERVSYDPWDRRLSTDANRRSRIKSDNTLCIRNMAICRGRVFAAVKRDVLGEPI